MIFAARWSSCSQAAPQHPTGREPGAIGRMRQTVRSTVQILKVEAFFYAPNFEMLLLMFPLKRIAA